MDFRFAAFPCRNLERTILFPSAILSLTIAVVLFSAVNLKGEEPRQTIVVQWNAAALQGVRASKLAPPATARALAIVHTCIYDAWAAYDPNAFGTMFGRRLRRPQTERTEANKVEAISYAAYSALVDLLLPLQATVFDPLMAKLGFNPTDTSTDITTARGIGNVACAAVLRFRHHDGSNQLGDLAQGAYSDYTGYAPLNVASTVPVNPATISDPSHWQPLTYTDATGTVVTQTFAAPFWSRVTPFALKSGTQFRWVEAQYGPAQYGSQTYAFQARQLIEMSANLTDTQKMIAEYWALGPHTEQPPGYWNLVGQYVSGRDRHGIDDDVKMFFALTNAVFDAGIASWDAKGYWDSIRPVSAIPYLFQEKRIRAWGGPGKGTIEMNGSLWIPYQATTFPTPPFASFTSGHSTFSAAAAEVLKLLPGAIDTATW